MMEDMVKVTSPKPMKNNYFGAKNSISDDKIDFHLRK